MNKYVFNLSFLMLLVGFSIAFGMKRKCEKPQEERASEKQKEELDNVDRLMNLWGSLEGIDEEGEVEKDDEGKRERLSRRGCRKGMSKYEECGKEWRLDCDQWDEYQKGQIRRKVEIEKLRAFLKVLDKHYNKAREFTFLDDFADWFETKFAGRWVEGKKTQ